jgi:hypothetical protein
LHLRVQVARQVAHLLSSVDPWPMFMYKLGSRLVVLSIGAMRIFTLGIVVVSFTRCAFVWC